MRHLWNGSHAHTVRAVAHTKSDMAIVFALRNHVAHRISERTISGAATAAGDNAGAARAALHTPVGARHYSRVVPDGGLVPGPEVVLARGWRPK